MHLIEHLEIGGAERMVTELAQSLAQHGVPVSVCLYRGWGPLADSLIQAGVPVVRLPKELWSRPLSGISALIRPLIEALESLAFIIRLARRIRRDRIDVLQTHMFSAGLWGRLAARLAHPVRGMPVIITEHTLRAGGEGPKRRFFNRVLAPLATAVVAVSAEIAAHVKAAWALEARHLVVIPNAVDTLPYEAAARERAITRGDALQPFILASVGRLVPVKRHDLLLEALHLCRARGKDIRCLIIGDGPLGDKLKIQAQRLGLFSASDSNPRVIFLGIRQDIPNLLAEVDAVVNCSDREGLPVSLLEAFAAALPVVATRVGGTPEVVIPDQTGLLIPPGDPNALAGAILCLAEDRPRARALGQAGQALILKRYSLDTVIGRWCQLYRDLSVPKPVTDSKVPLETHPSAPEIPGSDSNRDDANPRQPHLGYLFILFPKVTETFNLREMIWLSRKGFDITVFSLTRPRGSPTTHPEALPFLARTHYGDWAPSLGLLRAHGRFLQRHPRRYLGLLAHLTADTWRAPTTLLKSLAIFPMSVHFAAIAAESRIDHLHATFGSHNATAAWIMSRLTGIPYSMTIDAYDLYVEIELLERKIAGAQFVTTISAFNAREMVARYGTSATRHVHVNRRGIDLDRFKPGCPKGTQTGPFNILCVGSFQIKKGQRFLIDAIARLHDQGHDIRCTFIGDGPTGPSLRQQTASLGLGARVVFLGNRTQDQVIQALRESDAFVLPSIVGPGNRMEGIPNALMEAMACEVPAIGTDLSGTPELIQNGENGLLVPPENANALSSAILRLKEDPAFAARLARAGRETVARHFNQEINIAALLTLYHRAIANPAEKVA